MKTVAVTGLHRGENPQPGAAVIASLRRAFEDLRIIGFSYDPMESGLYGFGNDRPDAAYLLPYPSVGHHALLERLDDILAQDKIDYIIPCLDSEFFNFIAISDALKERGIGCLLPGRESFLECKKTNIYAFCSKHGFPAPRTIVARDVQALSAAAQELDYPVYVKGKYYEARLVYSLRGLLEAADEIARVWGWPLLVQEAMVGEEYDVTGIGDGKGGVVQFCAIRKLLRSATGKGYAGVVVEDPALDKLTRDIIGALKWHGPFELEFIKEPGRPHALFEMNPRFPAWIDFPSQIGCNMPARLMEELLGLKPRPMAHCAAGQMFIRHSLDIVGDISDLAEMAHSGHNKAATASPPEPEIVS